MIYEFLQNMIKDHIYYKEISKDNEKMMKIWCNKDSTGKYYFIIKLGGNKE